MLLLSIFKFVYKLIQNRTMTNLIIKKHVWKVIHLGECAKEKERKSQKIIIYMIRYESIDAYVENMNPDY